MRARRRYFAEIASTSLESELELVLDAEAADPAGPACLTGPLPGSVTTNAPGRRGQAQRSQDRGRGPHSCRPRLRHGLRGPPPANDPVPNETAPITPVAIATPSEPPARPPVSAGAQPSSPRGDSQPGSAAGSGGSSSGPGSDEQESEETLGSGSDEPDDDGSGPSGDDDSFVPSGSGDSDSGDSGSASDTSSAGHDEGDDGD